MSKLKLLYACLATNWCCCAVAEVSDEEDIPHAQEVVSLPPHDAAIQDAPPPARMLWIIASIETIATIAIIVNM